MLMIRTASQRRNLCLSFIVDNDDRFRLWEVIRVRQEVSAGGNCQERRPFSQTRLAADFPLFRNSDARLRFRFENADDGHAR